MDDLQHRRHECDVVVRKLVGVPAELLVTSVRVDRAEDAERRGGGHFMLEAVASEGRMVDFEVDLDLVFEAIALQDIQIPSLQIWRETGRPTDSSHDSVHRSRCDHCRASSGNLYRATGQRRG